MAVHANGGELQHLSSFYRLLGQASASKSEREIVRICMEALAVWQDTESWAYVADVTGRFVLDLTLPGSDRSRVPALLNEPLLPTDAVKPARVPLEMLASLGFRGAPDLLAAHLRMRGTSDWLIVTEHPGDADAEARLGVYVHAVAQALGEADAIGASRFTWALLEHLLPAGAAIAYAAEGALAELASSAQAAAWLAVFSDDGTPVLTAGDLMGSLSPSRPTRLPHELVVPIALAGPYDAVVGVQRRDGGPLTGRDEHLLAIAASTLGTWLNAAIDRLSTHAERRKSLQSFDHVLKQRIDGALAEGTPVSMIVASFGRDLPGGEVAHEFVARIRRALRPADVAGRLSSGHIAVLLSDTPPDDAGTVVERLRRMLSTDLPPTRTGGHVGGPDPTARDAYQPLVPLGAIVATSSRITGIIQIAAIERPRHRGSKSASRETSRLRVTYT